MMSLKVLFIIFVILVGVDKVITILNLKQAEKNFDIDYLSVEKNPVQKSFFKHYGLILGAIMYGFISLLTIVIGFLLLSYAFGDRIALYVVMMVYGLVIINNIFWFLHYSKII